MTSVEAKTYTLTIPDWVPTSTNQLMRGWRRAQRRKAHDREMVAAYARIQQIAQASSKRRLSIIVTVEHRGHLPDADNVLKSCLDALVQCRRLVDDDSAGVELGPIRIELGAQRQTVIVLEEILS